jgi:hypothetical protein
MIQLIENIHTYDEGYVLYGFDEIGLMVETNAQHAFVKI